LITLVTEERPARWSARPSKPLRCDYVPGGFDSYLFRQQPLYTGVSEDRGVFGYTLGTLLPKKKSILRASRLSLDSI
jgi:hypothetical protein